MIHPLVPASRPVHPSLSLPKPFSEGAPVALTNGQR